jgi:hypothetical protein
LLVVDDMQIPLVPYLRRGEQSNRAMAFKFGWRHPTFEPPTSNGVPRSKFSLVYLVENFSPFQENADEEQVYLERTGSIHHLIVLCVMDRC